MRTSWWGADANLTLAQEALRTRVHEFARERIRPAALELDRMPDPQSILAEGSPLRQVLKGAYEERWPTALIPAGLGRRAGAPWNRTQYSLRRARMGKR
jgi:alkylation response protein AidB-like acyl-CoA dehydrogenase